MCNSHMISEISFIQRKFMTHVFKKLELNTMYGYMATISFAVSFILSLFIIEFHFLSGFMCAYNLSRIASSGGCNILWLGNIFLSFIIKAPRSLRKYIYSMLFKTINLLITYFLLRNFLAHIFCQ